MANVTRRMDLYPLMRCNDCGRIEQRVTLSKTGACEDCGGLRFRPALKIDDATEARLKAEGFEFTDEWFQETNPLQ